MTGMYNRNLLFNAKNITGAVRMARTGPLGGQRHEGPDRVRGAAALPVRHGRSAAAALPRRAGGRARWRCKYRSTLSTY